MKRHLRTIRGPQGLKGEKGLSAYGVWLKAGHTGTKDDFFSFLRPKPYVYTAKTGQSVPVGKEIELECLTSPLTKGRYLVQISGGPEDAVLGLCYGKVPVDGGICVIHHGHGQGVCQWPCTSHPIQVLNYSEEPLCFSKKSQTFLLVFTAID